MAFYLEVENVSLRQPGAWQIGRSLTRLLGGPAKRGENTLIPTRAGRDPNPMRVDQGVYDLEMLVMGRFDGDGMPYTDEIDGKVSNLLYLRSLLVIPEGTLFAELHLPDASTLTGMIQVINWVVVRDDGGTATVTFDVVVPAGMLELGGS